MTTNLTWTNEIRKLSDLVPWPLNPRQIRKDQAERLSESLDEFAQVETIAIGPGDEIYNGHQRLNVWIAEHGPDFEVDVRVASRALSERERQKLTVYLHKGAAGEFDFDMLANWGLEEELLEWGFKGWELGIVGEGNDVDELWKGMPEFEQEDLTALQIIKVHFATREDVEAFSQLISQKITEKTRSLWYPPSERLDLTSKVYKDES